MSSNPLAHTQPTETLGNKIRSFSLRYGWFLRWGNLFLALVCFLFSLAVFDQGYSLLQKRLIEYGSVVFWKTIELPLILGALFLYLVCAFGWLSLKHWKMEVILYENGLIYQDNRGVQIWLWSKVVRYNCMDTRNYLFVIPLGTTHQIVLKNALGKTLLLSNNFNQIDSLIHIIRQKLFTRLYASASTDFNAYRTLEFGTLKLNKRVGLLYHGKTYGPNDLDYCFDRHGSLKITHRQEKKQETIRVPIERIPNLDILLALLSK